MKSCPVCKKEKEELRRPHEGFTLLCIDIFGKFPAACSDCLKGPLLVHRHGNGARGVWNSGSQVEHLDETTMKFTCPLGHSEVVDFTKRRGKQAPMSKQGIKMMASWWGNGRVTFTCKVCARRVKKIQKGGTK